MGKMALAQMQKHINNKLDYNYNKQYNIIIM